MSETLTPENQEKQLTIGEQFERTVAQHLLEGQISVLEDRRYGLTVAVADYAIRGVEAKQIVRFKEYDQETNITGVPGHETRSHRYAIEHHRESSDSNQWNIDYAIEYDTATGEFWKRIEDRSGVSHHRLDETSFIQVIVDGVQAISKRNDLVPLKV